MITIKLSLKQFNTWYNHNKVNIDGIANKFAEDKRYQIYTIWWKDSSKQTVILDQYLK